VKKNSRPTPKTIATRVNVGNVGTRCPFSIFDSSGFTLDQYLWFGGYPGAAPLAGEPERWRRYLLDALVETTISRDVLLLSRVDKPALLRRLFELGCRYSGQVLSYTKMLGQLHDAGNATTLAHYLELLAGAGMLTGLSKYSGKAVRSRGSSPKLQVLNTALLTAQSGLTPSEARADPLCHLTGAVDGLNVVLAWAYVGIRVVHSLIQGTINFIPARFAVFTLGTIVLIVITARSVVALLG
jgi:predicted AAA+ superfamily ATPase